MQHKHGRNKCVISACLVGDVSNVFQKKKSTQSTLQLLASCGLVTRAEIIMKNRFHRKMTSNLLFVKSKHHSKLEFSGGEKIKRQRTVGGVIIEKIPVFRKKGRKIINITMM